MKKYRIFGAMLLSVALLFCAACNQAADPSVLPSVEESVVSSVVPSVEESVTPSVEESVVSSVTPSVAPSVEESVTPSVEESVTPSVAESLLPSVLPSVESSVLPSPSVEPSLEVSVEPSAEPSVSAEPLPSPSQEEEPSVEPSEEPSAAPEISPEPSPSTSVTVNEVEELKLAGMLRSLDQGTEFTVGDLVVTAVYTDGTERVLTAEEYEVDGSAVDMQTPESYVVVVSAFGVSATYRVRVKEVAVLVDAEIADAKTQFYFGDEFYLGGFFTLTGVFSNGKTQTLQRDQFTVDSQAFDSSVAGYYEIFVTVTGSDIVKTYVVEVMPERSLRLLTIGNSFSDDTMEYVYQIAQSIGVEEIIIGNLFVGSCTVDMHWDYAKNDVPAYDYRTYYNGAWHTQPQTKLSTALVDKDWQYISMQQSSPLTGEASSMVNLQNLIYSVLDTVDNPNVRLVWNMTWAFQADSTHWGFPKYNNDQMTMYNAIIDVVKSEVLTKKEIYAVNPAGTAIQNARTSYLGDTLTRDGYHLSLDYGRYLAGLTMVGLLSKGNLDRVTYLPKGIKEEDLPVLVESVKNALENPYAVTPSKMPDGPAIDMTKYEELQIDFINGGFYNATDWQNYDVVLSGEYFVTTKRFTREELPVGSLIVLAEGWTYRPEGWVTDAQQTSRAEATAKKTVVVTEEWWGDYTLRAFNIYKEGMPSLVGEYDLAAEAFKIYIPVK